MQQKSLDTTSRRLESSASNSAHEGALNINSAEGVIEHIHAGAQGAAPAEDFSQKENASPEQSSNPRDE